MSESYTYEYTEGGVGAFEAILTGGIAIAVEKGMDAVTGDKNHGWDCKATDKITGLKATRWGATQEDARKAVKYALDEKIENFQYEQKKEREEVWVKEQQN